MIAVKHKSRVIIGWRTTDEAQRLWRQHKQGEIKTGSGNAGGSHLRKSYEKAIAKGLQRLSEHF